MSKPVTAPVSGNAQLDPNGDWIATDSWVRFGILLVVGLVGGLFLWSVLASISGAVVASGTVTVETNYKAVQHLDGGIVAKILVRNGDRVQEGDALLRLDPTVIQANLSITVARIQDFLVQQARLEAERDRRDSYVLPDEISATRVNPTLEKIIVTQMALFEARRKSRLGEQAVLSERLQQGQAELAGLTASHNARRIELAVNTKELKAVQPLFDQGFASQQRLGPLQRESARLEGEVGRLRSDMARSGSSIAETKLRMAQAEKEFTQQVVDELRKVQASLAELHETRLAQEDKLRRIDVRAPRPGRVHGMTIFTEGGVVPPGGVLMQIIPENEKLIVEAQLSPQDMDKVRKDSTAFIRFPAFNARVTPKLDGRVSFVSPAQIVDQQGRSYFTAQVEVSATELGKLGAGHELVPGMPAEVYIETGARSMWSYLVKPLTDSIFRSFRER